MKYRVSQSKEEKTHGRQGQPRNTVALASQTSQMTETKSRKGAKLNAMQCKKDRVQAGCLRARGSDLAEILPSIVKLCAQKMETVARNAACEATVTRELSIAKYQKSAQRAGYARIQPV
jgi:hypothetical protein